jgi:carbamoyltransferase
MVNQLQKKNIVLGISGYYHDAAASLIVDGNIIAAAHEERFTRVKHDAGFPHHAIEYCLNEAKITLDEVTVVVFYDKPLLKFERLIETYLMFAPRGLKSFISSATLWIKEKLFLKSALIKALKKIGAYNPATQKLLFTEHHLAHAASAFYPSPFEDAAILTIDGVGEWATTTICHGKGASITMLKEMHFPHSLGLLYSAFTYYTGFKVNSGEYKLMGLAPYGDPQSSEVDTFVQKIKDHLISIHDDGSLFLHQEYFNYAVGLTMINEKKWHELFGLPTRKSSDELTQAYCNIALAIQRVTDEIVLKLARYAQKITGSENLVLAGGVALNCVSNSKVLHQKIFKEMWIQPAAGDAGGALGAALGAHYIYFNNPRVPGKSLDGMHGSYLGPAYSDAEASQRLRKYRAIMRHYSSFDELAHDVAKKITDGNVVGWFQGRMEWGPRALGNRSILGDPRNEEMQKKLNLKIKYRESFRPFAGSVLDTDTREYFDHPGVAPYMLLVADVTRKHQQQLPKNYHSLPLKEKLYYKRSDVPAITHLDYSCRLQTVHKETNERYWNLINAFKQQTGCGIIINTSFNVRGEPIVCTPEDAYRCFMNTEMDYLVIGNLLLSKKDQPEFSAKQDYSKKAYAED